MLESTDISSKGFLAVIQDVVDGNHDAVVTLEIWRECFERLSDEDTGIPLTSAAAAKCLSALEYFELAREAPLSPSGSPKAKSALTSPVSSTRASASSPRRFGVPTTKDFWKRVTSLFNAIDTNKDKSISRAELLAHFRGNTRLADKYMHDIDMFDDDDNENPDGLISLQEWQEYFFDISDLDTTVPETSPAASKALAALEYEPTEEDKALYAHETVQGIAPQAQTGGQAFSFWKRVDKVFETIMEGDLDGQLSRGELLGRYRDNAEAEHYVRQISVFHEALEAADNDDRGFISQEEFHEFFQTLAEEDTFMPSTSSLCAKALAAFEYAEKKLAADAEESKKETKPLPVTRGAT